MNQCTDGVETYRKHAVEVEGKYEVGHYCLRLIESGRILVKLGVQGSDVAAFRLFLSACSIPQGTLQRRSRLHLYGLKAPANSEGLLRIHQSLYHARV